MFGRIDHIGVAVEDLDDAVALYSESFGLREQHRETVEDFGVEVELIDQQPRTGIRSSRVAFLHPKSTGGVLTELVEPAH